MIKNEHICSKCLKSKPFECFSKNSFGKDGLKSQCKDCVNTIQRSQWKKYKRTDEWDKNHPDKILEYSRRGSAKRRSTPNGKLAGNMAINICKSLHRGAKRRQGWESLVGYTFEELKKHLEKQFSQDMTWDNYGKYGWHIDHIIPIAAFNFERPEDIDFQRCWTLGNLRPLKAHENHVKRAKIDKPFQPSLRLSA